MSPIIMLILSALGGGISAASRMGAANRENRVAGDQQNRELQMQQNRAAKMEDIAGLLRSFEPSRGQYGSEMEAIARELQQLTSVDNAPMLEAEARRQLERNSGMLDAALASRGMFSSGYGVQQQNLLASETLGSLAQAIAADRQQALANQVGGRQAAASIFGGLDQMRSGADAQRLQALQTIASLYSDPAFGAVGMNPYQMPQSSPFEAFMGFLGGAAGGAATTWGADPSQFRRGT